MKEVEKHWVQSCLGWIGNISSNNCSSSRSTITTTTTTQNSFKTNLINRLLWKGMNPNFTDTYNGTYLYDTTNKADFTYPSRGTRLYRTNNSRLKLMSVNAKSETDC